MEPALDAAEIPSLPRPLTLEHALILRTYEITGYIPYKYQVRTALALLNAQDVLSIARTDSGKTLPFVMPCFLSAKPIIWIVSPLNYIEEQQCDQFREWGLTAIAVNASTCTPQVLEDIKAGKYQVVISSPESYHSNNKLRKALLSPELEDCLLITVFDQAHCIKTWGDDFRKAYSRCGDLRPLMLHPERCPILATTATASDSVKRCIIAGLKLCPGFHFENLGNFCSNLCYGVHRMSGGQKSYSEVGDLFPANGTISEQDQAIVFVNSYMDAHAVAGALLKKFGLKGRAARNAIPVYHSLKCEQSKKRIAKDFKAGKARILVSTEAMTMGVDFPNVKKVVNYLVPHTQETCGQRSGRGARGEGVKCDCIIMATPKMLKDAAAICKEAGINISGQQHN
ncbi:hypothetical protein FRC08_010138 [Ceratobasidium sp. 394]|nr:hypothetical protein FRC08_010138 [Ceratobasidium sp. 394]KAG9101470.1 hypothetical protein FS749_006689 [Ceratobasidium sp. UAMH 11750]